MAALAAVRTGSGTGKCGWPMLRLTGSFKLRPSSKTLRTPDISMPSARSAIHRLTMCQTFRRNEFRVVRAESAKGVGDRHGLVGVTLPFDQVQAGELVERVADLEID